MNDYEWKCEIFPQLSKLFLSIVRNKKMNDDNRRSQTAKKKEYVKEEEKNTLHIRLDHWNRLDVVSQRNFH